MPDPSTVPTPAPAHRYDRQEDRCSCGGQIVCWEDDGTYGCDVGGPLFGPLGQPVDARLRPLLPEGWVDLDQDPTGGRIDLADGAE
jgi:hypothetical protein